MKILKSITNVTKVVRKNRELGKTVGLVFGAFDVMHMGHIDLFKVAKRHVDILVVGIDNDETLRITKGATRPINNYKRRSEFLSYISLVDYIFKIPKVFSHGDESSTLYFNKLYMSIQPTHVFTHTKSDNLSGIRSEIVRKLGIKFIPDKTKTITYITEILKK